MKGANLIIGLVSAGKAEVVDHYGTMKDKHKDDDKIGGQTNVSNVSGSEAERHDRSGVHHPPGLG